MQGVKGGKKLAFWTACRDLPLLQPPEDVLAAYGALPKAGDGFPDNATLSKFVNTYFGAAGRWGEAARAPAYVLTLNSNRFRSRANASHPVAQR